MPTAPADSLRYARTTAIGGRHSQDPDSRRRPGDMALKLTFAPVFTSPLRRPFRTSRLAGFSTVTEHGVPGRGRPRARAVPPLEHADGSSLLSMPRQGDPPRVPASSDDR